jgi:hypothetical protein
MPVPAPSAADGGERWRASRAAMMASPAKASSSRSFPSPVRLATPSGESVVGQPGAYGRSPFCPRRAGAIRQTPGGRAGLADAELVSSPEAAAWAELPADAQPAAGDRLGRDPPRPGRPAGQRPRLGAAEVIASSEIEHISPRPPAHPPLRPLPVRPRHATRWTPPTQSASLGLRDHAGDVEPRLTLYVYIRTVTNEGPHA